MQQVVKDLETRMQAALDLLSREFAGVRTGRASTALLDNIRVEAYGNLTPINQLASLSVPDSKTLMIQAWDASQLGHIEKAILKSDIEYDQLILEYGWVHVGLAKEGLLSRREALTKRSPGAAYESGIRACSASPHSQST